MKSPARKPAPKTAETAIKTGRKTARIKKAVRAKKTVQFLEKPTCATCRKARRFLEKRGFRLNYRDITKDRLSVAEIAKLIGSHDHEDFLRPNSDIFRKKNMKENPPSRREAIGLMARNPELIRRPVVVAGGRVVIGYDENGMIRF